jgi:hypothetical protein
MIRIGKDKKIVSGPLNVIRIEGSIGSDEKKLYLFMDAHKKIGAETGCDDIFALDIDQYLYKELTRRKDNDIIYIFLENYVEYVSVDCKITGIDMSKNKKFTERKKNMYIENLNTLLNRAFENNKKD